DPGGSVLAGLGARRCGRRVDRGLRPLLLAVRRGRRPGAGAALLGAAVWPAGGLHGGARTAPPDGGAARRGRARAACRRALLGRRGRGSGAARVRAFARRARRSAPAEHGVLHDERRDQRRVLRLRARRRARVVSVTLSAQSRFTEARRSSLRSQRGGGWGYLGVRDTTDGDLAWSASA